MSAWGPDFRFGKEFGKMILRLEIIGEKVGGNGWPARPPLTGPKRRYISSRDRSMMLGVVEWKA
jgi:hypothetical protein